MTHYHFIGIGGSGLSAIARVLLERGETVSGSDRQASPLAEGLRAAGARIFTAHAPGNLAGAEVVIRSSAVPDDNVEVAAARALGLPVLKRSEFLGPLLAGKVTLAVAGSHGKTTTTAMLAFTLDRLGLAPSFIVGGVLTNLGHNARSGAGPHFVIEADEYDYMFLGLSPALAILTNIEHDHPDMFPTPEIFAQAFHAFIERIQPGGTLLACGDDPGAAELLPAAASRGLTALGYGIGPGLPRHTRRHYRAVDLRPAAGSGFRFIARFGDADLAEVALAIPGEHNVRNALAVLAAVHRLGYDVPAAAAALGAFTGVGRRFEWRGEAGGVTVIDDYAHHPTEIRATLAAARARYPGRPLWAVWQPHTFSRTRTLLADFGAAFGQADHLLVTAVYPARETAPADFSPAALLAAIHHPDVRSTPTLEAAAAELTARLRPGDVLLVFSAGDATRLCGMVLDRLARQPAAAR